MKPEPPPILLLGPGGQVGWELRRTLSTLGPLVSVGRRAADHPLDLARPGALAALIDELQPALVVNAAAWTAVDDAEAHPQAARRINAEAVAELGEAAARRGAAVVHFSTDYVFPGEGDRPLREEDPVGPINQYGQTKLAGEKALAESGADHLILRLAWVYGARGRNFLLTMRRLMTERERIGVVADQFGAPTWSRQIGEACAQVLAQCRTGAGFAFGERGGIYHLTAAGQASWHQFAEAIRDGLGLACAVDPLTSDQYPTPARRPAWSVLDSGRLARTFGVAIPHWRQGLALCLEELAASA